MPIKKLHKKIKNVDINTYYDGLFKDYRSVLEQDYLLDIYVSKPTAYIIEGEIVAFAGWVSTDTGYTIFGNVHYLMLNNVVGDSIVTKQYKFDEVIDLLQDNYEFQEVEKPFFYYVLTVTQEQRIDFKRKILQLFEKLTPIKQHEQPLSDQR